MACRLELQEVKLEGDDVLQNLFRYFFFFFFLEGIQELQSKTCFENCQQDIEI